MSPLIVIDVEGHPFRMPLVVAHNMGIEPGDSLKATDYPDIERSMKAYATVTHILDRALAKLFPDPCGPIHYMPDPACPECEGKGRTLIPEKLSASGHRVENCRTCIQPYPRRPDPLGAR